MLVAVVATPTALIRRGNAGMTLLRWSGDAAVAVAVDVDVDVDVAVAVAVDVDVDVGIGDVTRCGTETAGNDVFDGRRDGILNRVGSVAVAVVVVVAVAVCASTCCPHSAHCFGFHVCARKDVHAGDDMLMCMCMCVCTRVAPDTYLCETE